MGESTRACPKCGGSNWGTRNRCNTCVARQKRELWASNAELRAKDRERLRAWRKANPAKVRAQDLRKLYALDTASFEAMLVAQQRRCAICETPNPDCVDHCHVTGRVRGILCRPCNTGRDKSRRRRYGVDAAQFAAMLRSQGGVCRICKRPQPNCVDHCHRTGRFRGVLCLKCNSGLGYFREDLKLMRAAVEYLASGGVVRLDNETMTEDGSFQTKPR
jgi:hypothetical protein